MGKLRKIEIDDRMPCDKNEEPLIPRCENLEELWPAIITKAVVKLFSYKFKNYSKVENIIGDVHIINALTGYFAEVIDNNYSNISTNIANKIDSRSNSLNPYINHDDNNNNNTSDPNITINNNFNLQTILTKIDVGNHDNYIKPFNSLRSSNSVSMESDEDNYVYSRNLSCYFGLGHKENDKEKFYLMGYTYFKKNDNDNKNSERNNDNPDKKKIVGYSTNILLPTVDLKKEKGLFKPIEGGLKALAEGIVFFI